MDVGKLEGSRCDALGLVFSSLGAQHYSGGAEARFTRVITPHHVHYAIGHVNRFGGHINRSIARRPRDLHAWHVIAMVKSHFH